jgi:tetratricopeptide (TPR) repeat protein
MTMKKLFLLIAVITVSFGAFAQKGKVTSALSFIDQGALDKAKEAIDQALVHEKSMNWANTYFAKGKLCQAVYESDNPKFKSFYSNPLAEAYAAYEKAIELDPKGGTKKKIIANMVYNSLALDFFNQASKRFEAKDYAGALDSFENQIKITESDKYAGIIDTGMYYNAGLAALNAKKYQNALGYFQKCIEMKYLKTTPYFQLYESYMGLGDTTKAESTLLNLLELYPDDKNVTLQLIDMYLKSSKYDEANKFINIAKQKDPGNFSLYFAAGIIYLNQNKFDEAIQELSKSIELKSDFFDTQYSMGAAYINKASDMFVRANDIMDVNKYTAAIEEAMAVFAKGLPYMEKAYELNPKDINTLTSLKELYYRLKQTDKYEKISKELSDLQK